MKTLTDTDKLYVELAAFEREARFALQDNRLLDHNVFASAYHRTAIIIRDLTTVDPRPS